jgi:hypothetical protein
MWAIHGVKRSIVKSNLQTFIWSDERSLGLDEYELKCVDAGFSSCNFIMSSCIFIMCFTTSFTLIARRIGRRRLLVAILAVRCIVGVILLLLEVRYFVFTGSLVDTISSA